jgi:hypothetical protein
MSALIPKADIGLGNFNVRFVPEPDIGCRLSSQRSARRTLQRPLFCIAPLARASLGGFRAGSPT